MAQAAEQHGVVQEKEQKHMADLLDETVAEAIDWESQSAIFLRKTLSGGRRGGGHDVYAGFYFYFRKLYLMTNNLPDVKNSVDATLIADIDEWLADERPPNATNLRKGMGLLREYLAFLYEKGVIQLRR